MTSPLKKALADKFDALRKKHKIPKIRLSEQLGFTGSTPNKVQKLNRVMASGDLEDILKLSEALDEPVEEILSDQSVNIIEGRSGSGDAIIAKEVIKISPERKKENNEDVEDVSTGDQILDKLLKIRDKEDRQIALETWVQMQKQ